MTILFPLAAVFIWSVNVIVSKLSAGVIDPAAISVYRWLLAFLVLTPMMLPYVIRNHKKVKAQFGKLLVLGMLGMGLNQTLTYHAAQSVSAVFMGIYVSLVPLFTILISLWLLHAKPTAGIILGSILAFFGLCWLVSGGQPERLLAQGIGKGELMMIAGAIVYALYGVLIRRWQIDLPPWQSLYIQIACGMLVLSPGLLLAQDISISKESLPLIFFAGVPTSIIAPFLWIQGVKRLGANTNAMVLNLLPVFTAIIAVLFLHEQLQRHHIIGGGVILLGIILAQRLRALPANWRIRKPQSPPGG